MDLVEPVLDVVRMADQNPYYCFVVRVGEKGGEVGMLQLFVAIWMYYLLLLVFVF